jgi:plasmid stability protein
MAKTKANETPYIINFPDDLHREAKVRAAQEGTTLKELIIDALTEHLKRFDALGKGGG